MFETDDFRLYSKIIIRYLSCKWLNLLKDKYVLLHGESPYHKENSKLGLLSCVYFS